MLRCHDVHKTYMLGRTRLQVLRGVSLNIEPGQFIAIVGASGSGKSTLLHVMSGLDVPQKGQVYYEGRPIFESEGARQIPVGRNDLVGAERAMPSIQRASGDDRLMEGRRNDLLNSAFGFVFQFYHLLPEFDVLENVELPQMVGSSIGGWLGGRSEGAGRARKLLDRVGLADRLHHRPSELSGGERQRVAIARALINQPALLFADEPTGNLDAKTGRDIFNLLHDLNKAGQTLVMVTHDGELAQRADVVVRLVDGRVESKSPGG
ncbi:MAG TPA: ABC transporter ATP-binding protein [Phycisphaerae bacterium]|nr:ABC transporter ATP-binding protein [Phycisphaerae bacterium]